MSMSNTAENKVLKALLQGTGLPLEKGDYIKSEEVVYVKDNTHFKTKITIAGDWYGIL